MTFDYKKNIYDAISGNKITCYGAPQVTKDNKRFANGSIYLTNKSFMQKMISAISGDITIDFQLNIKSYPSAAYQCILEWYDSETCISCYATNQWNNNSFLIGSGTRTSGTIAAFTHSRLPIGEWHHIAISRKDNNVYFFIDGILASLGSGVSSSFSSPAGNYFKIGNDTYGYTHGDRDLDAYIDQLRVSNVARWTTNFTPPAFPYVNFDNEIIKDKMNSLHGYK